MQRETGELKDVESLLKQLETGEQKREERE